MPAAGDAPLVGIVMGSRSDWETMQHAAAKLDALFHDPNPAETGEKLALRARERFTAEVCARRHLDLYRKLTAAAN